MPVPERVKMCSQPGAHPHQDQGDSPGVHVEPAPDELECPHKDMISVWVSVGVFAHQHLVIWILGGLPIFVLQCSGHHSA